MSDQDSNQEQLSKWLRLHLIPGVGSITFGKLLIHFKTIDKALRADLGSLCRIEGIGEIKARQIITGREKVDPDKELALAQKLGVKIITWESPDYPPLLKQIHDPPPVLYIKGNIIREDQLSVAIVGSRTASQYGWEQSSRLSNLLAASGFTIVSGLARGIDSAAHRGALAAQGRTIAVQGCGLAQIYPSENEELAQAIAKNGAIISELPLESEPLATNFPARNRIIAGMTLGTLVVEARPRSGALITARIAMEENREVMAVPGRIDAPGAEGSHQLIKDGAKMITGITDIMDALGQVGEIIRPHVENTAGRVEKNLQPPPPKLPLKLSQQEKAIIEIMDHEALHVEELILRTSLSAGEVFASLTSLQLKGLIQQLPGSYYKKR